MTRGCKIWKIWAGVLVLVLIGSCKSPRVTRTTPRENPSIITLPGYTFKDSLFTREDFNVFVITTEYGFDSLLTTNITNPIRPKFDDQLVLAIKAETANYTYKSTFREMTRRNRVLNVYFTVNKEQPGEENAGWVSVTTFPREWKIRRVNFYFDNMLIRSVPVVLVY
jgi:hypothetical protein